MDNISILVLGTLLLAQSCMISSLSSLEETGTSPSPNAVEVENIVTSKSLSLEENKIESKSLKRNPKFGFHIPLPMPVMGGGDPNPNATQNPETHFFTGMEGSGSTTATLGSTAVLIKGGILTGLMALKAAIIPPLFLGALILFLIAGAGFFTCSIVNCGRIVGEVVGPGPGFGQGPPPFSPFNRNGIDDYDHRPVFQAIDDGYQKFNN